MVSLMRIRVKQPFYWTMHIYICSFIWAVLTLTVTEKVNINYSHSPSVQAAVSLSRSRTGSDLSGLRGKKNCPG
jgi:hypothetical protein